MRTRRPFTTYRRGDPHPESGGPGYWGAYPSRHAPKTMRPEDFRRPEQSKPHPQPKPPASAKTSTKPKPPTKKKSAAGAKESKSWVKIVPHLKAKFPEGGPNPNRNASFNAAKDFLADKKNGLASWSTAQ